MSKKVTVHLRIYKGSEITLKADGKTVKNENQLLKLTYDDLAWNKHLANIPKMGICKVEVEGVYEGENLIETPEAITEAAEAILRPAVVNLSPEQKRIQQLEAEQAEMKAQLKALTDGKTQRPEDAELAQLKADFKLKFDKSVPGVKANDKDWIKAELSK